MIKDTGHYTTVEFYVARTMPPSPVSVLQRVVDTARTFRLKVDSLLILEFTVWLRERDDVWYFASFEAPFMWFLRESHDDLYDYYFTVWIRGLSLLVR